MVSVILIEMKALVDAVSVSCPSIFFHPYSSRLCLLLSIYIPIGDHLKLWYLLQWSKLSLWNALWLFL